MKCDKILFYVEYMFGKHERTIWALFLYHAGQVATIESFDFNYTIDDLDINIDVTILTVDDSVVIPPSYACMYKVNIFGSGNAEGSGTRGILMSSNLFYEDLEGNLRKDGSVSFLYTLDEFDILNVGCRDTGYLCLEFVPCNSISTDSDGGDAIVKCHPKECKGGLTNELNL